jgi:hypothetical protein
MPRLTLHTHCVCNVQLHVVFRKKRSCLAQWYLARTAAATQQRLLWLGAASCADVHEEILHVHVNEGVAPVVPAGPV